MPTYEEEHNLPSQPAASTHRTNRPDMTSFFSHLSATSPSTSDNANPHAIPAPADITALYRELANAYRVMQGETEGVAFEPEAGPEGPVATHENALLESLITSLSHSAADPPSQLDEGLPDSYCDGLERVPKSKLKQDDICPICSNTFLEDKYPLVVELPCGAKRHWFDLDCVRPWLRLKGSCPMDRVELGVKKVKQPVKKPEVDDEEEEWDEMFA